MAIIFWVPNDSPCSFVEPQELDWGVNKTFMELFSCRDCASACDGNPASELVADIGGEEYGPWDTPASFGLYGGWYTVKFRPGECGACHLVIFYYLTDSFLCIIGVNYLAQEIDNDLLICWR